MHRKSFVKKTISSLTDERFKSLRNTLGSDSYIPFDFVDQEKVDRRVLEEKVSDYFEKVELVAGGKRFNYITENYASALDSVVRERINKTVYSKGNGAQTESRAKKYYDEAHRLKKAGLNNFEELLDYSRIMLCLYMAIINNKYRYISDFDFSSECLIGKDIMDALRGEKASNILGVGDKKKFNIKGPFCMDRCAFVMVVIMYHYIKSREVEE